MATKIDEACRAMVEIVDDALACAVFELGTGVLLGRHEHGNVLTDVIVAAMADLIRQRLPSRKESCFREVHVSSADREYLARALEPRAAGLMLVLKKTTNVGMAYAQLRAAGPLLQSL